MMPSFGAAPTNRPDSGDDIKDQFPAENLRLLVVSSDPAVQDEIRKLLEVKPPRGALAQLRRAILKTPPPTPGFEFDFATNAVECLTRMREAKDGGRPIGVVFFDCGAGQSSECLESTKQIWAEEPDVQIVLTSPPADGAWNRIHEKLGRKENLLIVRKPFCPSEVIQAAGVLMAKWSLINASRGGAGDHSKRMYERTVALRKTNEDLRAEIAQRTAAEARLRHSAFHDALTNLPNRALLLDRVGQCIKRAKRSRAAASAVLFLDVDNFKIINDSLGHHVGDKLLVEVSRRIGTGLRSFDTVSRLGGDEFVILLENIQGQEDALMLAERIQERLAPPFELSGQKFVVTASIGIAFIDQSCTDANELLRNADSAMYRAKHTGKARQAVFDESMHVEAKARLDLENDMRHALDRNEIQVYYQPIVSLKTGNISGFEALMRWHHSVRGIISPVEFIPVSEETGLIIPLGSWILREACKQLTLWNRRRTGARVLSMGVNVSKRQLMEPSFCEDVARIIKETGVDSRWINLEVTESAIITGSAPIEDRMNQLKKVGVRLHMDDFGTGYSSLSSLHRYPFDVLKVDRAFVQDLGTRSDYAAIIRAIISLARHLNLKVTAEGVETEDQYGQIASLECDFAQGYLFSKPVPGKAATTLLTSDPCWRVHERAAPPVPSPLHQPA